MRLNTARGTTAVKMSDTETEKTVKKIMEII